MHLHFLEVTPKSLTFLKYNISGAFALQKSDLAWDEKLLMRFYHKALDYDADSLFFNLAVQVIEMMFFTDDILENIRREMAIDWKR